MTVINMPLSALKKNKVSTLMGSPPGYVGRDSMS